MILKNVASQGVYLYEVNTTSAPYVPKTGDATNITGSYTLDGTDHSGFGTANPTEIGNGVYWQPLAQGETNGNVISYRWSSSTANTYIAPLFVFTSGANLPAVAPGVANGIFIAGTNAATVITTSLTTHFVGTVDTVTTYTGNTPQTGDAYARLGAPAGASVSADIAAVKSETDTILTDVNTGGGAIYARLGAPAGASMSADIASVKSSVGSVTGAVGSVTGNVGGNVVGSVGSVTAAVTLLLTQALNVARALDSVADTSLTVNDALQCAVASITAQLDASSGTSLIAKTASTGTTLRTKTLTLISPPATVPDKAV